jgi:hypothetical protein
MLYPFFQQAGRSSSRQLALRWLAATHTAVLTCTIAICGLARSPALPETVGFTLLTAGIVEGAIVLGWRLVQLPRSRSLEPILLSPVSAPAILLGEQMVGLTAFTFLCLSGIPTLAGVVALGWLDAVDAGAFVAGGFVWGCITGYGLTWWVYESRRFRRIGERVCLIAVLVYLVVFGLAGEHLVRWLALLPFDLGYPIQVAIFWVDRNNPFGLVHQIAVGGQPGLLTRALTVQGIGIVAVLMMVVRAAFRLKGHYVERHYRLLTDERVKRCRGVGEHPLSWWAVLRVSEYPGRINLWLALSFSGLYATFLLIEDHWPTWLGTNLFRVFELLGGIPGFVTVLTLLAAVPSAYQYGLWDSSVPERCRRLELLLMTDLGPRDYLRASWSAAWFRGRGYILAALFLWIAGVGAGRFEFVAMIGAVLSGLALILLYFALGFRAFARNRSSASLGFVLTIGLPLCTWAIGAGNSPAVASCLPPGLVYYATTGTKPLGFILLTAAVYAIVAVGLMRRATNWFDAELRAWYDENHGRR